jgi:hypothetical protein
VKDAKLICSLYFEVSQVAQLVQCVTMKWYDRSSIPDKGKGFYLYFLRPASSGAHPASCTMGTGGSFPPVGKAGPGRDADHSPPSSAEVKQ